MPVDGERAARVSDTWMRKSVRSSHRRRSYIHHGRWKSSFLSFSSLHSRARAFHVTIYKRSLTCSAHFLRRRPINSEPLVRERVWWGHLLRAQTLRLSADDFGLGRSSIIKSLLTMRAPAQIGFCYRMVKVERVEGVGGGRQLALVVLVFWVSFVSSSIVI